MTALRQKMIDLMSFRQFSPKTHQAYLSAVTRLSDHYHRSPEQISAEEVKRWLIETANQRKWSASTVHQTLSGLKFLYHQVLEQPDFALHIPLPKRPQKIPALLTQQEVYAILQATDNLKQLALLSLCYGYGCGLLVGEPQGITSVQKLFTRAKRTAGINKPGGQLQQFLGHSDIKVTCRYLHWVPSTHVMAADLLSQFRPDNEVMKTSVEGSDAHF